MTDCRRVPDPFLLHYRAPTRSGGLPTLEVSNPNPQVTPWFIVDFYRDPDLPTMRFRAPRS